MAEKFTLDGRFDKTASDGLDENFFEEFSFDDFDEADLGATDNDVSQRTEKNDSVVEAAHKSDSEYVEKIGDSDNLAPKADIEPEDPMLGEFEVALAAEVQRVTREQDEEKKKNAAVKVSRKPESISAHKDKDQGHSAANVSGESIRAGGWRRRRRIVPPASESGQPKGVSPISHVPVAPVKAESLSPKEEQKKGEGADAEREKARQQERMKAAAQRAERVKAAKAAQAEAERQAAIARSLEAEEEEKRKSEALNAALAEDRVRVLSESRKDFLGEEEKQEIHERLELEEAAKTLKVSSNSGYLLNETVQSESDDNDDDGAGKGRTIITVSILLVLFLLSVGAGMTYFWSNVAENRSGSKAENTAGTAGNGVQAAITGEGQQSVQDESLLSPEEQRYLDESREAQAIFEEEQRAALARAKELEMEERNAMLQAAGMVGLPDISTRDLSEYLTEMPANGASICSTKSVMYSYDQMVKDLYFLTVQYGDYISTEIIGNTLDERAIYEAVIGNANASHHIIIYYALKGADYIDSVLAMNQLESYCKARKNGTAYMNQSLDSLFEDVCIHVIPMANPDGIAVSEYGIDALRTDKARENVQTVYDSDVAAGTTTDPIENYVAKYCANAAGVDLSRNFDFGWEQYVGGPDGPSASGYKGKEALSEPESQAIVNLADRVNAAAVIGYSTTGGRIEYGYGYAGPAEQGVADVSTIGVDALASALSDKTGYEKTEVPSDDENAGGGAAEYFLHVKHIPTAMVLAGNGEAPLEVTEMSSIWKANSEIFQMVGSLYTNGL